jgi:hypothetical protein
VRRDIARARVHLMHPIHKLGALLSSKGLVEPGHATF